MNEDTFKNCYRQYVEYCALLNYLRQEDSPDIGSMHMILLRMDEVEQQMSDYGGGC